MATAKISWVVKSTCPCYVQELGCQLSSVPFTHPGGHPSKIVQPKQCQSIAGCLNFASFTSHVNFLIRTTRDRENKNKKTDKRILTLES